MDYKNFITRLYQILDNELNKDPVIMSFSDNYLTSTIVELVLESFEVKDREKIKTRIVFDTKVWVLTRKGTCNYQLAKRYDRRKKN